MVSELPLRSRVSRAVHEAGERLGGCRDARTLSGRGELVDVTAGESTGIIGSLVRHDSRSSLLTSDNSSMGVACVVPALPAVPSLASASSSPCPLASRVAGAVHARRTVTPMHALDAHN